MHTKLHLKGIKVYFLLFIQHFLEQSGLFGLEGFKFTGQDI